MPAVFATDRVRFMPAVVQRFRQEIVIAMGTSWTPSEFAEGHVHQTQTMTASATIKMLV